MKGNRFATENLDRNGSDKQSVAKADFLYSIDEIMKKSDIKIQPPTKQCEPQSAVFTFNYMLYLETINDFQSSLNKGSFFYNS